MAFPNKKKGKNNGNSGDNAQKGNTTQGGTQQTRPQQQGSTQQQGGQSQKDPVSAGDMKRLFDDFKNDIKSSFGDQLTDHENRIKRLEDLAGISTATTPDPATTTASGSANPPSDPGSKAATSPAPAITNPASQPVAPRNGPGYAYKYWDYKTHTWGLKADLWAAKQASNGMYVIVWAWYDNDVIHHLLSDEEIKQYTP